MLFKECRPNATIIITDKSLNSFGRTATITRVDNSDGSIRIQYATGGVAWILPAWADIAPESQIDASKICVEDFINF